MKKLIMPTLVCLGLAMYSCNKNYNCYCNQKLNNKDTVFVMSVKESSKTKAKTSCENMSDSSGDCSLNN